MHTIMLAKDFDRGHLTFPAYVSRKYDGVPVKIFRGADGALKCITRQGKPVVSIPHIVNDPEIARITEANCAAVGEVVTWGESFKYISGLVRQRFADAKSAELFIMLYDAFECDTDGNPTDPEDFATRLCFFYNGDWDRNSPVHCALQIRVEGEQELYDTASYLGYGEEGVEGIMIRQLHGEHSLYGLNRSWGMMRMVPKPTLDLECTFVHQARALDGTLLPMVGAFEVLYKGKTVKVGAGKATFEERKRWWQHPAEVIGSVIQVQYKLDASYDKLRQPTFQRVRHDKSILDCDS